MKTTNKGNYTEISSDKYVHHTITNAYFKKGVMLGSISDYEEVDEIPEEDSPTSEIDELRMQVEDLVKKKQIT